MAEYNGFLYKKSYKDEIVITGIDDDKKYDEEINIPSEISGKKVISLSSESFIDCKAKRIVMPNTIRSIGTAAFYRCYQLEEMILSNKLKYIGNYAFTRCYSLKKIILPNELNYICNDAFSYCFSLEEICIPDSVTIINDCIFANCKELKKVRIGNNISELPNTTFLSCCKLEEIELGNCIQYINKNSFSHCDYIKNIAIGNNTIIATDTFKDCKKLEKINIPKVHPLYSSVDGVLFSKNGDTLLFYPIANPRKRYRIPSITHYIKKDAFENCENLENIIIDHPVTWI